MDRIRILAFIHDSLWEHLYVYGDEVINKSTIFSCSKTQHEFDRGDFANSDFEIVSHQDLVQLPAGDHILKIKNRKFYLHLNGLQFSYFVYFLTISKQYRICVLNYWTNKVKSITPTCKNLTLSILLSDPRQQVIDQKWCQRIADLVIERSEIDNAMSWLSTLGGAYSALGDEFSHCAQMAGRISQRQFYLALRLGDPWTVARCKLYIALSLIQTNRFKYARQIIEAQYHLAMKSPSPDVRLIRMCRGVWSKLRYEYSKYHRVKKLVNHSC